MAVAPLSGDTTPGRLTAVALTENTPIRVEVEVSGVPYVADVKSPAHHEPAGAASATLTSASPDSCADRSQVREPSGFEVPAVSIVAFVAMRNVAIWPATSGSSASVTWPS